jgi:hypothetical protein
VPEHISLEITMDKLAQLMMACDLANNMVGLELDYTLQIRLL